MEKWESLNTFKSLFRFLWISKSARVFLLFIQNKSDAVKTIIYGDDVKLSKKDGKNIWRNKFCFLSKHNFYLRIVIFLVGTNFQISAEVFILVILTETHSVALANGSFNVIIQICLRHYSSRENRAQCCSFFSAVGKLRHTTVMVDIKPCHKMLVSFLGSTMLFFFGRKF